MTAHPLGVKPAEPGSLHEQNESAHRGFLIPEAIREELLADALNTSLLLGDPPAPEEQVEARAQRAAADAAVADAHARLLAAAAGDELAVAVLELHRPEGEGCAGDNWTGGEGEPPEWPCATVRRVADHLKVEVPDDAWWDAWLKAGEP